MSLDPELTELARRCDARALHRFMCDAAEHAIARAHAVGTLATDVSLAALATKRRWLEGEATDEELTHARASAVWGLYCGNPMHLGAAALSAGWAPKGALSLAPDEQYAEQLTRAKDALEAALATAEEAVQAVIEAVYRPRKDVDEARRAEAEERSWQRARLTELSGFADRSAA